MPQLKMSKNLFKLLAGLSLLNAASIAHAYPDRPVKLIVPWAAGGDTDNIFRPFAPGLQKHLGQAVVIANVGGASGMKGAKEAKDAPSDGYTLYAVHDYIHSAYYTGVGDVKYTDFEPICMISATPSVLTSSAKTAWKDWSGLLADAKARPGAISVGATLGSTSHFFPAMVEKAAGIKFKYVSYDGLAPRMNAILGGHIDLTDSNMTQKGKVEAGQLRFIAIASEKRSAEMPSVTTLKELGVNVVYEVSRGLLVPKGTPAAVISKLESACLAATKETAYAESMKKQATEVKFLNRTQYAAWLKTTDDENAALAKDLGLMRR